MIAVIVGVRVAGVVHSTVTVLRVGAKDYEVYKGRILGKAGGIVWDDRSHRAKRPRGERWEAGRTEGLRLSVIRNARRDFGRQHDRRVGMAYPSTPPWRPKGDRQEERKRGDEEFSFFFFLFFFLRHFSLSFSLVF